MTKKEVVDLFVNLNKFGNKQGVKFSYGVTKNIGLLKPEVESIEKSIEMSPEFKEFDEKRVELVKKYATKDEKGNPSFIKDAEGKETNSYDVVDLPAFEKDFEELKQDNKELFEARNKQLKEYEELLKTDSTVTLYKISLSDIPNDITVNEMYQIQAIVSEDVPSPYNK